ncbi:MAG: hypothetical protein K6L73_14975, partial [Cellvibrionaceae bacterium]
MTRNLILPPKMYCLSTTTTTEFTQSCREFEDSFAVPRTSIYRPTVTARSFHRYAAEIFQDLIFMWDR